MTQWQQRHLIRSEFTFFQSLSQLLISIYFYQQEMNPLGGGSEREVKFYGSLFTCSIKCNIKQFHVVVIQKRQRNLQKSMVQV